jgi:hypothetical protein
MNYNVLCVAVVPACASRFGEGRSGKYYDIAVEPLCGSALTSAYNPGLHPGLLILNPFGISRFQTGISLEFEFHSNWKMFQSLSADNIMRALARKKCGVERWHVGGSIFTRPHIHAHMPS